MQVAHGVLIAESILPGRELPDGLVSTSFDRWENPAPAAGQPSVWMILKTAWLAQVFARIAVHDGFTGSTTSLAPSSTVEHLGVNPADSLGRA